MWQKLVAGACVMTGAVGFGLALCGELGSEIAHLKKQKELLLYIIGEIDYLRRPMAEILGMAAGRMGEPYARFLSDTAAQLEERSGKPLAEIWSENLKRIGHGDMPQTALLYMERMGRCFGCEGDRMQIEGLRLFERELDEKTAALSAKQRENSRLINALSALTGILCIILFL
ncbi:MAG: stage III sporulation protein AB [Lachnospiraceae bacterium]|nr:stage III sporulation protein AB [Lachnospiraceae bacterium]